MLTLEAHSLDDRVRDILDADREDERLDGVLLAPYQREELREVARVHRLPQSLRRAPDDERCVVLCSYTDGETHATRDPG